MRTWLLACAALLAAVLAAFHPLWLQGHSLAASLRGQGITKAGPYDAARDREQPADGAFQAGDETPVADAVAAFIDEPLARVASRQLQAGELPVWNPHNALGVPLLGNWQTAILNPLRALVHAFPDSTWAIDATYLLRLLVAGIGALLLARRLGLAPAPALAAGIAFGLTGYFTRYVQMHHLNGEVWLPWLWLAADVLATRRTLGAVLGFAAVSYSATVAGNPQPALVAAAATALFALARVRGWGVLGTMLVAGTGCAGVLLASTWWIAGLEYVHNSEHGYHSEFPVGSDHYTAAGALGLFVPRPYDMPAWLMFIAPYLGCSALALAALGAGIGLGRSVLLWGILVIGGGKLFGLPGTELLAAAPGFEQTKQFKYLFPPVALALALLAGNGVAVLAAGTLTIRRAASACGAVLLVLGAFTLAGARAASSSAAIELRPGDVLLAAALVAGAFVIAWRVPQARWRTGLAVALVALELILATPDRWIARAPLYTMPPALKELARAERASFRTFGAVGVLMPNQNAALGFDDIRLHDGVFPERYGAWVRRLVNPNIRHFPVFTADEDNLGLTTPAVWATAKELWRLILPQSAGRDLAEPVPIELFEPRRAQQLDMVNVRYFVFPNSPGIEAHVTAQPPGQYAVTARDDRLMVVERKRALARAFVPARCERVAGLDEALQKMDRADFDPRAIAYLETDTLVADGGECQGAARVVARPRPTVLELHAQIDRPGWLVVSVYPYPGWSAWVRGKRARLVPANATMSAVELPLGRHDVRLVYEPTWRGNAFWATFVGAGLLLLLACAAHWRRTAAALD